MEVSHEVREQRRRAVIEQELADARTLREVDTMLAFEAFEQAASALADVVNRGLANPEYRVRLFCVENRLGNTVHAGAEEVLRRVLLNGPASDNLIRALEIGRSLLPGHPLFQGVPSMRKKFTEASAKSISENTAATIVQVASIEASTGSNAGSTGKGASSGREFSPTSRATMRLEPR